MSKLKIYLGLSILVPIIFFIVGCAVNSNGTVIIRNKTIKVSIASSQAEKVRGLSGRNNLQVDEGMLFVYSSHPTKPNFWMKDMNFPIDIIWISGGHVVGFEKNLQPEGDKPDKTYSPVELIDYVLEVKAGFIEDNDINIGDEIKIN